MNNLDKPYHQAIINLTYTDPAGQAETSNFLDSGQDFGIKLEDLSLQMRKQTLSYKGYKPEFK